MGRESRVIREAPHQWTEARERERDRLKDLASRVKDEAHWDFILKACPTESDRESLEREVAPFLPWRTCANKECESGETPTWLPVLELRETADDSPARAQLLLRVCGPCRAIITLADVLTPDTWARIVAGYEESGAPQPDPSLTTLTFDQVQ